MLILLQSGLQRVMFAPALFKPELLRDHNNALIFKQSSPCWKTETEKKLSDGEKITNLRNQLLLSVHCRDEGPLWYEGGQLI